MSSGYQKSVKVPPESVPRGPAHRGPWGWFRHGGWYLVLTLATAGLCAWVPFLHAARRLRTAALKRRTAIYAGLAVLMVVLLSATPTDAQGDPVGTAGDVLSTLTGALALPVMIVALIQQWSLRRTVFTAGRSRPITRTSPDPAADPAVAEILAARARREQARALAAEDPLMARELRIGRPDLARSYDDGGLVDLNSAPAAVIARVCELDPAAADAIVTARASHGSRFTTVDEILVLADIPLDAWDRIRDRAVLIAT
ncbi:helix-hairpin-helix protein [Halopolyspora algeriensis]|uniref:Helix-hairpin-helix protein n=1 Tax=Halopolyspora algeriensis TaxID=1500506 RepID=A0A368VJN5_9ACTN|nr:helix-hairpin-helix domain-containing protein [Halopolyspora algeriensis]RCW40722.1 helix-hairpin-helix protein [Halopolyspora algeriensis]TQM53356.1 helix-hairpin-helix protein [Halopolyspora algeriensis]